MSNQYKLNLTKVLTNINASNYDFIDTLTEEELSGFTPYVMALWLKNADRNIEVRSILINEFLNPYVLPLSKHPKLLYKLMCVACGLNDNARYNFKKKSSKLSMKHKVISEYYTYTHKEVLDVIEIFNGADIIEMAEDMGYDSKDIKKLKGELDAEVI